MAEMESESRDALEGEYVRCTRNEHSRHWVRRQEILAAPQHAEAVNLALGRQPEYREDPRGIVCFTGIDEHELPHKAVEAVLAYAQGRWEGWRPQVSPNHLVAVNLDPTEGDVKGQPSTIGSPSGTPVVIESEVPKTRPRGGPGAGVTVGCFDTGIVDTPWLRGAYFASPDDFADVDANPFNDATGHGTFITGLILQLAPGAKVIVRKVLNKKGFADSYDLARNIFEFADSGIDVLNLSLGLYTCDNRPPFALQLALAYLGRRAAVVAAAGNHEPDKTVRGQRPFWPAAFADVVGVGALDPVEKGEAPKVAAFSNEAPWVDLWARGADLVSTFAPSAAANGNTWVRWSGTSFATALVSGAIAARMTQDGGISASLARDRLLADAGARPMGAGFAPGATGKGKGELPVLNAWPPKDRDGPLASLAQFAGPLAAAKS